MYYDNKSIFYVKQYGPKVLVSVLSIALIASGIFIYMKSTSNNVPQTNVAQEEKVQEVANNQTNEQQTEKVEVANEANKEEKEEIVEETNSLKDENKLEISNTISKKIADLEPLKKSEIATVKSVTDNNTVIVNIDNKNIEVNLIGADFSKSPSDVNGVIKKDLEGKEVTLAFDKVKVKDMKLYAYIYVEQTLYNASIIEKGKAIVKIESTNTSLIDTLISAQAKAKLNKAGIWAK